VGGTRRAFVLAAVLATPGCFLHTNPDPPACATPSSPRQTFLALYSIFYRVTAAVSGHPVPGWKPASLDRATAWLRCDPDDARRPGRIRYAAVKLAAGIVVLQRTSHASQDIAALEKALRDLIGKPAATTLLHRLLGGHGTDLPLLEDQAGTTIDEDKDEPELVALHRTCCPCIDDCTAGPSTGQSITEFRISVNRSPQCLFHAIDPQCWPSVVAGYANKTFLLSNAPACTGGTPACRSGSICDSTLPAPMENASAPQAGTPWCGLVYEDVNADSNDVTAIFRNVLKVTTSNVPPAGPVTGFRMDYGLCESTYWQMCDPMTPCEEGDCPITRDCGFARVGGTGVTGWARLDGTKRIQFKPGMPHDANLWAPLALEVLVKETALAACVPASACSKAATPSGCTALPGSDTCTCPVDHCTQTSFVSPVMQAPFCP
jgi:hypothetical protein